MPWIATATQLRPASDLKYASAEAPASAVPMPARTPRMRRPFALWLSLQRYLLLLAVGAPLAVGAVAWAWPAAFWVWGLAALGTIPLVGLAAHINRSYRAKLAAVRLARRRIANGTFAPNSVQRHCTDPCWRVVAHEILRMTGMSRPECRALVARLSVLEREQGGVVLFVDRASGVVHTYERGTVRTEPLKNHVPLAPTGTGGES